MPRYALHITLLIAALTLGTANHVLATSDTAFASSPGDYRGGYHLSSDTPRCTIPFTRVGNLVVLKARVDSIEGNFILDTGAPGLVLNVTYFRDYPTRHLEAEQSGITGTASAVVRTDVAQAVLGSFRYTNIEADLVNLGHIENSKNIRILGLIGMEFFRDCEMIIDFEKNELTMLHINRKNAGLQLEMQADTSQYKTVPFELMDNRIVTVTELAGKKLKMIVDCAAESSILNSKLPNRQLEYITITRRVKLTGSGSRQVDALYGNVTEMKIGGDAIGTLPVLITNLENTCFSYDGCIDGVLGFDFLSLQRVGFNFVKRRMYLWR